MERKVMEWCDAAKRAAEAAAVVQEEAEESRCVDALSQLKNLSITCQILVSTQVARHIRPLTKHPRKRIKDFASDLIVSWKNMFIEQTERDEVDPPNRETSKMKKAQKTDGNSTPSSKKVMRSETVVTEEEKISSADNVKGEKVNREEIQDSTVVVVADAPPPPKLASMIKCNDTLRDAIREKLYEALSKVASEAAEEEIRHEVNACDPIRVAVSVESVIFENWGKSNGTQKTKYRSTLFNLKDPKNLDFRRKVLLGHVKPETLVNMRVEEMASDERQRQNQQIKEKALFECELGSAPKATTDQFKCSRCGQRRSTYYPMQTRSADEPMTTRRVEWRERCWSCSRWRTRLPPWMEEQRRSGASAEETSHHRSTSSLNSARKLRHEANQEGCFPGAQSTLKTISFRANYCKSLENKKPVEGEELEKAGTGLPWLTRRSDTELLLGKLRRRRRRVLSLKTA